MGPGAAVVAVVHSAPPLDGYEDLVVALPDSGGFRVYLYPNPGLGTPDPAIRKEPPHPTRAGGLWPSDLRLATLGDVTGDGAPDLLTVEGSGLHLYPGDANGGVNTAARSTLAADGWGAFDLMAPGDATGDGTPDLWVRDRGTGDIYLYAGAPGNPAALADSSSRQKIGSGLTVGAFPRVFADGDLDNAVPGPALPDLWAVDGRGQIVEFPGQARVGDNAFAPTRVLIPESTAPDNCQSFPSGTGSGTRTLCGPVLAKYLALGGTASVLRLPMTDSVPTADGQGRKADFQGSSNNPAVANGSIYWSAGTGAWYLHGGTRAKWLELGAETGILGYPTADESDAAHPGQGWIATFAGRGGAGPGAITYSGATGSHEIHGGIYQRYVALGGPRTVGYASTDETPTPVKFGAYNHFRALGATDESSVYWSPDTGAHHITGAIRTKWAALGWENSYLGFPASDEYGVAGGRRNDFSGGYVRWSSTTATAADHDYNGESPTAHVTLSGDFNGDGRADLATVVDYGNCAAALWTSLADTSGTLTPPFESWNKPANTWCVNSGKYAAGDFNGDGRDDIAVLYLGGDGAVWAGTMLADTHGGFVSGPAGWSQPSGWDWQRTTLLAGDTTGDGRDELVAVYGFADGRVANYTFKAREDGAFNAPTKGFEETHPGWWYYEYARYALGDINGDHRADLIGVYMYDSGAAAVFTGLADVSGNHPGFSTKGWNVSNAWWNRDSVQVTTGDMNGDGRADLIMMYAQPNDQMDLFTFRANAANTLDAPVLAYDTGAGNWNAALSVPHAGDVDADGRTDVLTLYNYTNSRFVAWIIRGVGPSEFAAPAPSWEAPVGTW